MISLDFSKLNSIFSGHSSKLSEAKPPAEPAPYSGVEPTPSFMQKRAYNQAFRQSNKDNVELQKAAEKAKATLRSPSCPPLGQEDLRAERAAATTRRLFDGYDSSRDLVALYSREGEAHQPYRVDLEVANLRPAAELVALDSDLKVKFSGTGVNIHVNNDLAVTALDADGESVTNCATAHHSNTFNRIMISINKESLRSLGWKDGQPLLLQASTSPEGKSEVSTELTSRTNATKNSKPLPRWEGKIVYYAVTDRFHNGDKTNDGNVNKDDPEAFHGGDWQGVIDKLDYVKGLNIDCVWLSPPYLNERNFTGLGKTPTAPKDGFHGYWPMDFSKPDPNYGDDAKLKELTDKAHALDMKVMLDVVPNHTAYSHDWAKDPTRADWFHHDGNIKSYNQYEEEHGSLCGLPDLAQENPAVSDYLIKAHKHWLNLGVDAFRIDAARHMPEKFLRDFNSSMREEKPGYFAVGEVYDQHTPLVAGYQNRTIDSTFDFPLAYKIRNVFAGDPSRGLGTRLELFRHMLFQQPQEALRLLMHSQKHDTMESLSEVFAQDHLYDNPQKLGTLIDNHDMIRFMSDTGGRPECLKMATAFLMAVRGTPHVYYGTEIGAEGIGNANRQDMEFGKNPEITASFQALTGARSSSKALQQGHQVELLATQDTYALSRMLPDEEVVCVFNNSEESRNIDFALHKDSQIPKNANLKSMLDDGWSSLDTRGKLHVRLPAMSYAFFRWCKPEAKEE